MKSLTFRKVDGVFVAEFAATNNFNLHIEGVAEGNVRLYQRGVSGGDYSLVRGLPTYPSYGKIFDCDFTSPVWPKYLKVECATEPVSGYVTESTAVPGGGGGGSDVVILNQTKSVSITENGSVSVTADEGFTGLDRVDVDVNVEHVVSNQEKTVDIVANGTTDIVPDAGYDGLGKVSVKVNVPTSGGGGVAPAVYESDVNFRDYDGTLLHSYTKDEFLALSALPELPTREGLICQEWNWDLAEAQAYVNDYDYLEVGATYITDDGKSRFYIKLTCKEELDVVFNVKSSRKCDAVINWGDGSAEESFVETTTVNKQFAHSYADLGDYIITVKVISGNIQFGYSNNLFDGHSNNYTAGYILKKVELGSGIGHIGSYSFQYCKGIRSITIPKNVTDLGDTTMAYSTIEALVVPKGCSASNSGVGRQMRNLSYLSFGQNSYVGSGFSDASCLKTVTINKVDSYAMTWQNCTALQKLVLPLKTMPLTLTGSFVSGCKSLRKIEIPEGVTKIPSFGFSDCESLSEVIMPETITEIGTRAFYNCKSLRYIRMPKNLATITASAFSGAGFNTVYDFSNCDSIPTVDSGVFTSSNVKYIVVPDALYDEWIVATNWSTYASYIVKASQYFGGSTITFTIDGNEYQATEGMTWIEWCESEYNTEGWYADEYSVWFDVVIGETDWDYSEWKTLAYNGEWGNNIPGTEVIESGKAYLSYTDSSGIGGVA